jgi:hypothetical protein
MLCAWTLAGFFVAAPGSAAPRPDVTIDEGPRAVSGTRTDTSDVSSRPDSLSSAASPRSAADTSDHPNTVPYETDRSVAYHVLASPAYVLDAATWPLGITVRYLENNFPSIFKPKPVVRGVRPLFELGGPNGVELGLLFFHHDLWNAGHDVRLSGEVAARESWDVEFRYQIPDPIGPSSTLSVYTEYGVESRRQFFVGGNDADRDADEAQFYGRRFDVRGVLDYAFSPRFGGQTMLQYEHVRTRPSDEDPVLGDRIVGQPGLGVFDLATVQTEMSLDLTRTTVRNSAHRRYAGTALIGRVGYTQSINSDRFRFARLMGEVQQYLPVPVFPTSRRIALRARVEKAEPLFDGEAVPFYDLPGLGGQESLRGFTFDRFVDDGTLLFNAEYRYPIWDAFDAVLFVDAGQAFTRLSDLAADRFRWSYGGGVHILTGRKLAARFEIAYGEEGVRTILTVTPAFGTRPFAD